MLITLTQNIIYVHLINGLLVLKLLPFNRFKLYFFYFWLFIFYLLLIIHILSLHHNCINIQWLFCLFISSWSICFYEFESYWSWVSAILSNQLLFSLVQTSSLLRFCRWLWHDSQRKRCLNWNILLFTRKVVEKIAVL